MPSETITIRGQIEAIFDAKTFGSGFTVREFVVTTDDKYPQKLPMQVVKDKCSLLDRFRVGQPVVACINLRGRESGGRYYLSAECWKLEPASGGEEYRRGTDKFTRPPENKGRDYDTPDQLRKAVGGKRPASFDDGDDGIDF